MHRIRLRSLWQRQLLREGAELEPSSEQVALPDRPLQQEMREQNASAVEYVRSFNCPTGIDTATPLWLVIDNWRGALSAWLDRQLLVSDHVPDSTALRLEITGALHASHRVRLRLKAHDADPQVQLDGMVAIEIAESAADAAGSDQSGKPS